MGIKINIEGNEIEKSEVGTGMKIRGDAEVNVKNNKMVESYILKDADLDQVMDGIKRELKNMDKGSEEYKELREIVLDTGSEHDTRKRLVAHIGNFAGGVLQSVIADCISNRLLLG